MSSNRIADVELAHTPLPAPREESSDNVIGGVASGGVEVAGGFELELDDVQLVGRQGSDAQSSGSEFSEGGWRTSRHEEQLGGLTRAVKALAAVVLLALATSIFALALTLRGGSGSGGKEVHRIAFGSCSSYDNQDQPVWEDAVIPSAPDAWIWTGDFAYLDNPTVNCDELPGSPQCTCEADWLHQPPHSCMAGDLDHAASRLEMQLTNPGYRGFLEFMCPGHVARGLFPPPGGDPAVCPRAILGTYDDHDYGWNDGNKRLPHKSAMKQLFLDALGVAQGSPRRNRDRGIEWRHTLNEGTEHEIDVFLLDERYNRDPLPCEVRRGWCEKIVLPDPQHRKGAWCEDFLHGGEEGRGSCCGKDEAILHGYCLLPKAKKDPLYPWACDPLDARFGTEAVLLDEGTNMLRGPRVGDTVDVTAEAPFCDVLGRRQREWLAAALEESTARVKLVVSGSVLLGSPEGPGECSEDPTGATGATCFCSGDDMECYRGAQSNLLHTLARAPGCVVVLAGDYHYSDIKVVRGGNDTAYARTYQSQGLQHPLYQVMASGLTAGNPMATSRALSCSSFAQDRAGLRDHP
eukprot:CAMPEP_0182875012 /NCGR_PEP_ID=MMETSP0034_2-20130328/13283_1 /TAXON_ID=156128 /ORGANISM="Nephroselmis pyriformis, Strain CCMP717" /LENGTH=575 /DNA_ID=CAMNT_0025007745 /DNA_START=19 /DNA_END=1742 /DNA_ORIENTATION=+